MHSHERTLLSRLGFQDKDKANPEHDLACAYVRERMSSDEHPAECEVPISKGSGKYKTTIGFVDVLVYGNECTCNTCMWDNGWRCPQLIVEVKTSEVSTGDVLRQIGLYREYLGPLPALLVLMFEPSEVFVSEMKARHIDIVRLGPAFRDWLSTKKARVEVPLL
jgi:hypothetical protein